MKKSISLFLITTFIIQSCVIYQKTPVALEDAVEKGKVMVVTNSGQGYEFLNILKTSDEKYLGVNNVDTMNLENELVSEVYLKDKLKSILATIGVSYFPALLVAGLLNMFIEAIDN